MAWPCVAILAGLFAAPAAGASGGQYAPTALTAAAIFELNRHATGSLLPGVYHIVSQTTSANGDVWTAETYRSASAYRTTIRQGRAGWSYGASAGHSWHQDANGLVTKSTGLFQEADPFTLALRRPQDSPGGARVLGLTNDPSPAFVVEVTPNSGLLERWFYDAQSHLLTRKELVDYDGHKQVFEYGDYIAVFGVEIAHAITYRRDGAAVTSQTKLVTYDRLTTGGPNLAAPVSRRLFDVGDRDSVVIPAEFTDQGIFVPVTIENRILDFQLDSGSSDLLIDPGIAKELGMRVSGALQVSFAGDFTLANTRAASVTIGALSASDVALSTAPFQEDLPGRRIVGLLGTDFIASGPLELNFEKKTMTLFRSLPENLAAEGWSVIPVRMDYGVPMLEAAFSGKEGHFVVDLGADYATLYPHYFAQFPNHIGPGDTHQEEMMTLGGKPFGITHLTMKNMVLGDWVFGGVQVVVPSAAYAQERDYDGLIGREILSNFALIFDYADQQLWFKPIDFK